MKDKKTEIRFHQDLGFCFISYDFVSKTVAIRAIRVTPDEDFCVLPQLWKKRIGKRHCIETRWLCLAWLSTAAGRLRPTSERTGIVDRYGRCYKFVPGRPKNGNRKR